MGAWLGVFGKVKPMTRQEESKLLARALKQEKRVRIKRVLQKVVNMYVTCYIVLYARM